MRSATRQQLMKKKKAIAGFPLNTFSFKMGKRIMTNDAAVQLSPVAKGTYLGYTVSEM